MDVQVMGVFKNTAFVKKLYAGTLQIPEPSAIPGCEEDTMPYVFLADDAFPLSENIMKPYTTTFQKEKVIFNYRLSSVRRVVCFWD